MDEIAALIGGQLLSAAWAVFTGAVVPIAAAGVAALVVVRQIRQLDRHRTEDRRAEGLLALTELLGEEAAVAADAGMWANAVAARFQANESLVRAYALLPDADLPVARWIAKERIRMTEVVDLAGQAGEFARQEPGPHRGEALKIAAEAMQTLLDWQRGELRTSWFEQRL
ncbi:hypothetical protein [Microbacterium sp. AG238]|uniref:hypothetical protein n=1 Tax=Microbacterium sp. AG238 TaxID=2183994 RepID=UPI000E74528A|nr:hypothetical protein [Microbacterium sp. AG238]RKE60443.1 hypothetical protein DEU36_2885 [Microbacterium sp. AG238]